MVNDFLFDFFKFSIDLADIFFETISSAILEALGSPTNGLAWPAVISLAVTS